MPGRRHVRRLYSWASAAGPLRRPLEAVRSHPRVRAFARRHVEVLLSGGTTWANVDGALRLLAEDPNRPVVFGQWPGDPATELLYWAPFVRWAQEHFSLDPTQVRVVTRAGSEQWYGAVVIHDVPRSSALFPAEPVAGLVEEYRSGSTAPRPLLKRSKHIVLQPPVDAGRQASHEYVAVDLGSSAAFPESEANRSLAARLQETLLDSSPTVSVDRSASLSEQHAVIAAATGLVAAYSGLALLAAFSGVPVVALRSSDGEVAEPDIDLALRVTSALGGSLTIFDAVGFRAFSDAIGGR